MEVANTIADYDTAIITAVKCFMELAPSKPLIKFKNIFHQKKNSVDKEKLILSR
jgi:hypothetical protein